MVEYYDRVIIGIAGSLAGGFLLSTFTPIGLLTGVFLGSLVATMFMYDAMFRNPPLPRTDPRVAMGALVWHVLIATLFVAVFLN